MNFELIKLQESEFDNDDFNNKIKLGDFEVSKETIFIFDGNGIIAFNKNLDEIWRNHKLAIDGVIFQEMLNDDIMSIDCEMDPPGGWINRKINIKTGEIVNFII